MLPLLSDEDKWPVSLRGVLYGIAMVYCFLGVSIIADIFMDSITVITSRRKRVRIADDRVRTEKVWNDTVATLSLMALGSSAPEICLNVVEILKRDFHIGGLGPSTIVGSAAFNLLVIIAVCMVSIPSDEVRRIAHLPVFYVTAAFSVIAYLWIVVILTIISVDRVEIWEAAVTLCMLPCLVWVSFKTDTGDLQKAMGRMMGRSQSDGGEITVADKTMKSYFSFSAESIAVARSQEDQTVEATILRSGDCKGPASCAYRTERFSAVPEYDYAGAEGFLEFEPGVDRQTVEITILKSAKNKARRDFFLVVEQAEGAEFNEDDDGGEDSAILTVIVGPATDGTGGTGGSSGWCGRIFNRDAFALAMKDWLRQTICALYCNGSAEDQRTASLGDWATHLVTLPWKVLFLPVPPLSLFGGWSCFYGALVMIAGMTAIISDLAELFGCVLNIADIITALTFVSLGTSMPDLFASMSAARVDPTADAAIVNVTGSNAVNVYLGLGLPWTIGAIYWACNGRNAYWEQQYPWVASEIQGAAFVVDSRNLGFSVLVFTFACIEALLVLYFRRKFIGAELGGPMVPKAVSAVTLVAMWVGFCGVISWRAMRYHKLGGMEEGLVLGTLGAFEIALGITALVVLYRYRVATPAPRAGRASVHSRPQLAMHRTNSAAAIGVQTSEPQTRALKVHHRVTISKRETVRDNGDGTRPSVRGTSVRTPASSSSVIDQTNTVGQEMPSLEVSSTNHIPGASVGPGRGSSQSNVTAV